MKDEDLALLEIVRQRLERLERMNKLREEEKSLGLYDLPEDIYPEEDTDTFRDWTGED
jgi:hypothetical protein